MRARGIIRHVAIPMALGALLALTGCPDEGDSGGTTDVVAEDTGVSGDTAADTGGAADVKQDVAEDTGGGADAMADVAEDTGGGTDVVQDVAEDIGEDVGMDVAEDVVPDIGEDVGEDIGEDIAQDTGTDVGNDVGEPVCDPPCTENQTCIDGTCVDNPPVCDPACTDGQVCVNGMCLAKSPHAELAMLDGPFADGPAVTAKCITCHATQATDMLSTSHWTWTGPTPGMVGHETETTNGKVNTINNFCIAIASNEGRCTQCHAGYGWKDPTFDFTDKGKMDCLVCHDGSGTYSKDPKTAGGVAAGVDLVLAAKSVGEPTNKNCGFCHFGAGGGDNVKKGDMGSWATNPGPDADVHMGNGLTCAKCHAAGNHKMAGGGLHNPVEEAELACETCHQGPDIHANATLNAHTQHIACETCHIPAFSRQQPTKMEWYWATAGDGARVPVLDQYGKPDYDKLKGDFVWGKNVEPELAWSNGTFTRMVVGDTYSVTPVDLGSPLGSIDDPQAKIAPFKVMKGNQPADTVNKQLVVPHLFGTAGGANPYWSVWDWDLALQEGAVAAGQPFSGTWDFVETSMYMEIHHEVALKSAARQCMDCHNGGIDFLALGYTGDPMVVGGEHATE